MKLTFAQLIAALFLVWSAAACAKESADPQDELSPKEFVVKAKRDGADWVQPSSGTYSKSRRTFNVFGADNKMPYGAEEYLRLTFTLPSGETPNQLPAAVQSLSAEWVDLVGGDVRVDSYATANLTGLPTIQITRLDTVQKIVEGRFEATLLRDKHYTQQTELMRFTQGAFRARYQEVP